MTRRLQSQVLEPTPEFVVSRQRIEVPRQPQDRHDPHEGSQGEPRVPRLDLVKRATGDAGTLRDDGSAQVAAATSKTKPFTKLLKLALFRRKKDGWLSRHIPIIRK